MANAGCRLPERQVQTRAQFEQSQQAQVNQLLGLVYALLALAILIALIGIVNTLDALGVRAHARDRPAPRGGHAAAPGAGHDPLRSGDPVASSAPSSASSSAPLLGVAFAASLKQQGITDIVVPVSSLIVFLVLAALLGLGAASWPARRAAKLDVLAAIATE